MLTIKFLIAITGTEFKLITSEIKAIAYKNNDLARETLELRSFVIRQEGKNLTLDRESTCSVEKNKSKQNVPAFFKYKINCACLIFVSMFKGTAIIHIGVTPGYRLKFFLDELRDSSK